MTYEIEQVNIAEPKPWAKNGKSGTLHPVGLKIAGKWYNQTFFKETDVERFKTVNKGDSLVLELYKEEYNGKYYDKFRMPTEVDLLTNRVTTLENFVKDLVKSNNLKFG